MSGSLGGTLLSSTAPGGGGGLPASGGTTDGGAGTTYTLTAGVASWNRSASTSGANTYNLPADATPVQHVISWQSGNAPTVNAPGGWHLVNPITGVQTGTSYTYGQGGNPAGESWTWVADVVDSLFYAL